MVRIKFDQEIENCLDCPFVNVTEEGIVCSRTYTYFVARCSKTNTIIKTYDRGEYIRDDFNVDIPNNCPFNKI